MPSTRSSTRKMQTRLNFTPLPSSSPATKMYPTQIQERAASVRYDELSSPSKKRRLGDGVGNKLRNGDGGVPSKSPLKDSLLAPTVLSPTRRRNHKDTKSVGAPPTPIASSQIFNSGKRLDPESMLSSSDSDFESSNKQEYSKVLFSRRTKSPNVNLPMTPPSKSNTVSDVILSGNSHHESRVVKSKPSMQDGPSGFPAEAIDIFSSGEDMPLHSQRKRKEAQNTVIVSNEDESDAASDNDVLKLTSPHRNTRRSKEVKRGLVTPKQRRPNISSRINSRSFLLGGSTGNAPVSSLRKVHLVTPTKSKKPKGSSRQTRSSTHFKRTSLSETSEASSRMKLRAKLNPLPIDLSSDDLTSDSGNEIESSVRRPAKGSRNIETWISSPLHESITVAAPPSDHERKDLPNSTEVNSMDSGDDSEDIVISPPKRKRLVRPLGQSPSTIIGKSRKQVADDLQEDLEDLQETEVRDVRIRGPKVNSKGQALELLRQRRAKQKLLDPSSDTEENARPARGTDEIGLELDDETHAASEVSEEEEESGNEAIRQSLRADVDDYDEDFVTDDDEAPVGAPTGLEEMPLQFTRHASKKPKEYFKDVVEWMVHNKLNPAFARNDPVYQNAFFKLDDLVKGFAGSKFLSSAWLGDFARAIKARPELIILDIPTMLEKKCDACNRSGHPASFRIEFSGKAYHKDSLEPVSDDEDDSDGNENALSHDERGNPIPSTDKQYFVGRFCKANAEIGHSLLHWRYHLNEWVLDWLTNQGHTGPAEIVERETWSTKKRREFSNRVVDEMEDRGEVKALYRDFKINLEAARDYKPQRYRGR